MGYVNRTKVADLANDLAKVLSKTRAYIAPSFGGTSYVPVDTLFASHVPYQDTGLSPIAFNFSVAVDDAFFDE